MRHSAEALSSYFNVRLLGNVLTEVHKNLCYLGTGGPGGRRQGVVPLAEVAQIFMNFCENIAK